VIALGIAPGIASLAYSVIAYEDDSEVGEALDSDVLKAGRGLNVATAWEAAKRCRAHHLILDVVCDRYVPAVVGVGPPADAREPPDNVAAVRLLLATVSGALRVPLVHAKDICELLAGLKADPRTLVKVVRREVPNLTGYRDRRIVLATASAIFAVRQMSVSRGTVTI
jgi:hypothetical protein